MSRQDGVNHPHAIFFCLTSDSGSPETLHNTCHQPLTNHVINAPVVFSHSIFVNINDGNQKLN